MSNLGKFDEAMANLAQSDEAMMKILAPEMFQIWKPFGAEALASGPG